MREREPFIIFPRSLPSGNVIYYYSIYRSDGKRRQYSTGSSSKAAALRYCIEKYKSDSLQNVPQKTFSDFASGFFAYESCQYIKGRIYRGAHYSRTYAHHQRAQLLNSILPTFGSQSIIAIRPSDIEIWLLSLKNKGLSHVTINHYLSTLKTIFREAHRLGEIEKNPAESIRPFIKNIKEKGILSFEEVRKLFSKQRFPEIWESNERQFTLNATAVSTGMRMGEILSLKRSDIYPTHIHVSHSWERVYGEKGTKTGRHRDIPIPDSLYRRLMDIPENKNCPYIFSHPGNVHPFEHRTVLEWLYKALEKIGIYNDERNKRNITFHSWRHFFNTQLRIANIPDAVTMRITGHQSDDMMNYYTHQMKETFSQVRRIQKRIIEI